MRIKFLLAAAAAAMSGMTAQADPPVAKVADAAKSASDIARKSPAPERFLDNEEQYVAETQRLTNLLQKLRQEEEVEQRMLQLRTLRGEGRGIWGLPTLVGIGGADGRLTAKLVYSGKGVVYARAGDTLLSDYQVQSISPTQVVLRKGKDNQILPLIFSRSESAMVTMPPQRLADIPVDSAGPIVNRAPLQSMPPR